MAVKVEDTRAWIHAGHVKQAEDEDVPLEMKAVANGPHWPWNKAKTQKTMSSLLLLLLPIYVKASKSPHKTEKYRWKIKWTELREVKRLYKTANG